MNESTNFANEVAQFHGIPDDLWDDQVNIGVPLYQRLRSAGERELARQVRESLQYLSQVINSSGHRDQALIDKIETGIR